MIVWQWPERTMVRKLEANPFSDYLRRSPDGRWLAAGCWANNGRPGSFVGIWSPDQAAPVQRLPSGNADVFFSPDGRTCLVGEISGYREFDTTTWQPGRAWPRPSSGLAAARAAWSPDNTLLCLHADDTTLRLLDATSREEIARLSSPIIRRVERFEFSPDGRWLVAISSRALHVWDLRLMRTRLAEMGLGW
jgi:WD40 repeat protein